VTGAEYSSKV